MNHLPETLAPARLTVTPAFVTAYAELTQDFNPIHLDAEFAAKTPMGSVIAHGTMSIGLIWQSLERSIGAGALAGAQLDIRFVKPVRLGETLIASGRLRADADRSYEVWVRAAPDGADRLAGSLSLAAAPLTGETS
jgi:3-hydroxybutyryl-CoA dehydratase